VAALPLLPWLWLALLAPPWGAGAEAGAGAAAPAPLLDRSPAAAEPRRDGLLPPAPAPAPPPPPPPLVSLRRLACAASRWAAA